MSITHAGALPIQIFKDRRSLESETNKPLIFAQIIIVLSLRMNLIKAIADYITTALNLDVVVEYGTNDDLKAYEDTLKLNNTYTSFSLKEWIIKRVGWYKQTDP